MQKGERGDYIEICVTNYNIDLTEEYIKIELISYDGKRTAYRFFFDDIEY